MRNPAREGRLRAALRIPEVGPRAVAVVLCTVMAAGAAAAPPATRSPGNAASTTRAPVPAPTRSAAAPAATGGIRKVAFVVTGMVCPLCTRGVEEAIRTLPGVGRVAADLDSGRVEVEAMERHSLDIQQLRERAARAGFPARGDADIEARGRFEIGPDARITFRPAGAAHGWQVLESSRLLALARAHPGFKGEYIIGFRLYEQPPWKRAAISLTRFEAVAQ